MENRHHFFWPRNGYKTRLEKELRGDGLTVVRVSAVLHKELHATLAPPPKPTRNETILISERLESVTNRSECPYRGILEIVRFYSCLSDHHDPEVSGRARSIQRNLISQLGILATEVLSFSPRQFTTEDTYKTLSLSL